MKNFFTSLIKGNFSALSVLSLVLLFSYQVSSQCTIESGSIKGQVFIDYDNDGVNDSDDLGLASILVTAYNNTNDVAGTSTTKSDGSFIISGLVDGSDYRLEFDYQGKYSPSYIGSSNSSSVQFVSAPVCDANFGLVEPNSVCGTNPELITTCFVQGPAEGNDLETIVAFEYQFNLSSKVKKYATHKETGSIWGLAWKASTSEIFSTAFVKQYGGLIDNKHGAIYRTKVSPNGDATTNLFLDLATKTSVGDLAITDITDCAYGSQVGKIGLGATVISPDEEYLYITNIGNKSLVRVSTTDVNDFQEYDIPDPGCKNGEYVPFALKYYNGKIYLGITCTAYTAKTESASKAIVYEWDPNVPSSFNNIFETSYIKGFWKDSPSTSIETTHWFTDIDFTVEGNMIIGLSDRIGHRYCKVTNPRLDAQNPDILLVYKDKDGNWKLEENGQTEDIGGTPRLQGSGIGNGQGPKGGEFFGFDHWPASPVHHPEVALGSFFVLPNAESGKGTVVASVYDPATNSYSGGFHRYSTFDGSKHGAIELYTRNPSTLFGKATGFGEVIPKCSPTKIQIGNYVWLDTNKNGIQDSDEKPVSGLTINLLDDECNVLGSVVTGANGSYTFDDLIKGKQYYLAIPPSVLDEEFGLVSFSGNEYVFTAYNSTSSYIDSDASLLDIDCGKVILPVNTEYTNHNYDIGLIEPGGFDLALKKEILNSGIVKLNEVVPFRITVYNQGGIPAKNIIINDYIPSGYEFLPAENTNWTINNSMAKTKLPGTLLPGASTSTIIKLKVISVDLNELVNVAEISHATDHKDNVPTDIDSEMDDDMHNDVGGDVGTSTDDTVTDDGTIDEDDSDPAVPQIFDLALKQYYEDNNCITGGSEIVVKTCVYNQGNVASDSYTVINYGAPNLIFDETKNPAWKEENGKYIFEGGKIAPGTKVTIDLTFDVINISQNTEIVNYAEISKSIPEGRNISEDSDSTPDDIEDNDQGGDPNTSDDNFIFGKPDLEEDDHDPIVINSRTVDLALILTTDSRIVKEGDEACFSVKVFNQGFMPVKEIEVTNYLPEVLTMNPNQGWKPSNNNYYSKKIVFENSLSPGDTYEELYCVTVGDLTNIYMIENIAEISSITGMCGEDLSEKDRDSKSDDIRDNDAGGKVGTNTDNTVNELPSVDEDDHDPAYLINVESEIQMPCVEFACPTEPGNGLYSSKVVLRAPSGMTWTVDQALGYYTTGSTIGLLQVFANESLAENPINATESEYTITGVYASGEAYTVRLKSDNNDYQYLEGKPCAYNRREVSGPRALCDNAVATYRVLGAGGDTFSPSVTDGLITDTRNNGSEIDVTWNPGAGEREVRFVKTNGDCEDPAVLDVITGNSDLAMKCKSHINLSLDQDCNVEVKPNNIIAGTPDPNAAYAIMLTDHHGDLMPENIVDASHIGQTIEVKLIEGCGGNSCWGTITVEDKTSPEIVCEDVTVSCYKIDQYLGPVTIDNCGDPITMHTLDSVYTPVMCNPSISGIFVKDFQAEDGSGNKSSVCQQTIYIARIDLNDVVFPKNFKMEDALDCKGYAEDENGYPSPYLTGIPTIEGDDLYPNFDSFCNLTATYKDEGPYPFECAQKIIRKWTVWDLSCISDPLQRSFEQTIIIGDKENPTFKCPESFEASASYHDCVARVTLPPATDFEDDCATTFKVDMTYPGGFTSNKNGGEQVDLPVGKNLITYRVYDECDRSSSCTYTIEVSDETSPLAVCDQNTTISLLSDGTTYLYAQTLDDGSVDACGIADIEARRMDLGENCGANTPDFGPIVDFCCADVSNTVPVIVELRVTDINQNSNTCMVNVFVQDKTMPSITCPDDVEIDCQVHYDLEDLSAYGTAVIDDACGAELDEEPTEFVDKCRVGYIERVFTADDGSNTASCTQRINIVNNNPFNLNSITKPKDYTVVNTCSADDLDPDNLPTENGRPILNEGICDLVASTYKDKVYNFTDADGTCFKIIRRWTVINYCVLDMNDQPQEIEFDQVIKVSNTEPPVIVSDLSDVTAFLYDTSCILGPVTLIAEGDDTCTPNEELNWRYEVHLNGETAISNSDSGKGPIADASGAYPLGDHYILWSFEDMCGNLVTSRQDFSVEDNKKPTAGCLQSVAISLVAMDTDGVDGPDIEMACIGPDSLNASSSHPCLPESELTFSFDSLGTLDELCFDCFDLGDNVIEFYVIDPYGNFDICNVTVVVQDNNNVDICPDLQDCIEWPVDVTVTECNGDITPVVLNSVPEVDPNCVCNDFDEPTFVDSMVMYPNATCTLVERTWTVTFNCGTNPVTFDYKQKISVLNEIAPDIDCPKDLTVDANANCMGDVVLPVPTITNDDCNSEVMVTHNSTFADAPGNDASGTYPVGTTTIIFTVTDGCDNTNTCSTNVTVTDNTPPVAMCTDITISLDGNGSYTLTQSDKDIITDGSFDNCSLTLTVEPDQFDCEDVDSNVEITVIASDGALADTCTANVFVEDNMPPMALCTDITVELDGAGNVTLSEAQIQMIGQNSTDNCNELELTVDNDMFSCMTIGANTVTLTVTDDSDNSDTCEATVTVEDNETPVAVCADITVNLNSNGIKNLGSQDINKLGQNSTDNCTFNISADPNTFDCMDVGDNDVNVFITDVAGNADTCMATVTVNDVTPPSLPPGGCQDITIMLDAMLMGMLDADDLAFITDGASDACGFIPSANAMFDCEDIGNPVMVTVTLTDPSNNTTQCDILVTVEEAGTPTLVCNDITVHLDENGDYTLSSQDSMDLVDASMGNCGTSITIDQVTFDCDDIPSVDILITLFDATNTEVDNCNSTVTVLDTVPPMAICNDITVELDANGEYFLNAVDVDAISLGSTDACGIDTVTVNPITFDCSNLGDNVVTVIVTDNNNNTDTCSATVTVEDNLTISAVCNDLTVTVMSDAPYVLTPADSLAIVNGSTDNCEFTVAFDPDTFTCADTINSPISIDVDFFDSQGMLDTTCTSLITVMSDDTLICIANDITVYLDSIGEVSITPADVDGGSGAGCDAAITRSIDIDLFICNDVINSPIDVTLTVMSSTDTATCISQVTVIDTIDAELYCQPLIEINCDLFDGNFEGIAVIDSIWDNCTDYQLDTVTLIDQFNSCNQGILSRNIIVTDLLSGASDTCNTVISIIETSDPLTQADFNLPADVTVDNCTGIDTMFTGSVTQIPGNLACSFVEISFTDNPPMLPGMCIDTIQRTWTMVDTCNTSTPIAPYVQTIVVIDTISPELVVSMDTVFVANPNNDCEFFVDLSMIVSNLDCDTSGVTYTNNSPYADDPNSIDASGTYPENTTTDVTVIATDGCGNSDTISYVVVVEVAEYTFDCIKLIIPIDTVTFNVCVAATDVATFTGACDSNYTILLYDEVEDVLSDTLKFDCDDIGDNVVFVYLYQDSTLVDSCTVRSDLGRTLITVTDNGMDCPTSISRVSGKVKTYYNQAVEDVSIELEGSEMPNQETSTEGAYSFPSMPAGGNYMLKPFKDDGLLEGVSTLDLILIQRHLLEIESLHNTYDVVAADINNDNKISATDLVELRKNLLGIENGFRNNTSWKMIDAKYEFPVYMDPFAESYPLFYELAPMNGNILADFIAVKIGDVNGSYTSLRSSISSESRSSAGLNAQNTFVSQGEEVEVIFTLDEIKALYGLQFGLDIKGLMGMPTVEIEGFDYDFYTDDENIKISMSAIQSVKAEEVMMKVKFMTEASGKLSEIITLGQNRFKNEAYDANLNVRSLGLTWNTIDSDIYNLSQNTPNPWKDKTFISFNTPEKTSVEMKITDITGKVIYSRMINSDKGINTIEIKDIDVNNESGVFLISLDIDGVRLQQKMIRIN